MEVMSVVAPVKLHEMNVSVTTDEGKQIQAQSDFLNQIKIMKVPSSKASLRFRIQSTYAAIFESS